MFNENMLQAMKTGQIQGHLVTTARTEKKQFDYQAKYGVSNIKIIYV